MRRWPHRLCTALLAWLNRLHLGHHFDGHLKVISVRHASPSDMVVNTAEASCHVTHTQPGTDATRPDANTQRRQHPDAIERHGCVHQRYSLDPN
eukprot:1544083-Prymnesium_polylepis.2